MSLTPAFFLYVFTQWMLFGNSVGPKKYRKIARMYDRTGLSTKCTLIKIDLFRPSDPNSDLFRPFVEALDTRVTQTEKDLCRCSFNLASGNRIRHQIDAADVDFCSGHFAQQQIVFVVGKRLFSPTTNCWSALFFTLFAHSRGSSRWHSFFG